MTKIMDIRKMSTDQKIALLHLLGYNSDGEYVLDKKCKRVKDRYTDQFLKIGNLFIYPGSTIILDNNPLSISSFMEEYGDGI